MTSVSAQTTIPSQASNASIAQSTYASTAKKGISSPPIATGSSTQSPAVAVGGSAPVQQQHGKTNSVSPVNGKPSISPAVPAISAPAIAHSSSAINGGSTDHTRKSSVTINANGSSNMNGGPVGGSKIQFGAMGGASPAASPAQPAAAAPMPIPNSRVTDPSHSPTPIPAPSASGGRPPSIVGGPSNSVNFGSFNGGDGDRHMRQASATQGSGNPGAHNRRESSHSQTDMNNQTGGNRGGFSGQGGRGRGFTPNNPPFQPGQPMGFPPSNPQQTRSFQPGPGRGGMAPQFQQGGRPFPNSPHQPARSPALTHSVPGTPNMNAAMPMPNQQYPQFYNHMAPQQVNHPSSSSFLQNDYSGKQNRNGKKSKSWNKSENQGQLRHRPRESSRELFGAEYASQEPMHFEGSRFGGRGGDARNYGPSSEHWRPGHYMPPQNEHRSAPGAVAALMDSPPLEQSADLQDDLPPLPTVPPNFQFPSAPFEFVPNLKQFDLSPAGGGFEQALLTIKQQNYGGYQPNYEQMRGMPMQNPAYMYPQMQNMGYMAGPPQSPQPGYQQPNTYIPGQYGQAQPMSRNSSQMSEQRPASSMGQPQTPSMTPSVSHPHTPQPKASATPSSNFTRPTRKSAAIQIKRPDGETLDVNTLKAPASPAPTNTGNRARTPPVITSTPTPPPKPSTPQHGRSDSAAPSKTAEQIRLEMMEKVKKAAEADKAGEKAAEEAKAAEASKLAEAKLKEEEEAKEAAKKAEEESKAKEEADAKAAADKAKQDEEDELERQIAEMEAADAEREKKEAEIEAKRKAEKEAAAKLKAERSKIDAAESDRKLREQEREMERLEDEREKKRAEAEAKASGTDKSESESKKSESKEDAPATPSTLASKLSNLTLGTDSGASTPNSDDSMGPPPKINPAEKRGKPAALTLAPLNTKPIEPPQPSAALQSLKSARFLTVLNSSLYPQGIASPNPALNSAVTTKGKSFKYDKEFLLQFQKVFTEKPSMEFESQIKALIGDGEGGSARSGSTRTPGGGMGARTNSNRNPPGAFAMGSFGAGGALGGKTLPPGTSSADRFAMSNGAIPRPQINPMASFNRPGGAGFPAGNPMSRTPSSSAMPHSPRQPSRSQRGGGGSKRDGGYQGSNAKAEAQAAKTMPLTAGMDLKPIQVSASGWKPRSIGQSQSATGAAGPAPGAQGAGHMDPDMVQRKVKAALNKMTPEKFDKIADQILAIAKQSENEADGRTLRQVIQLTFEKATDEAHWASMYAKFCKRMLETMSSEIKDESIVDKNGNVVSGGNLFRKYLLNRCQEEFERGWKMDLPDKPEGERGDEKTEEAVMLSDEYYVAEAAKRRGLGLVQFIGELYKLGMLTERIMHECVKKLVDYTGIPDEAEIESLTKLLKTIGANLDNTDKGKPMMDVYFTRIQAMIDTPDLPSRLRFMLMDIVDLRKKRWASKDANKGPKTLDEVRAEAEAAAAQKAAENARGSNRGGGGGGGRMQMGRGDSRNFGGNQYGNQPPPDYQKNTVGMDDLRRLTNKGTNRASSAQMSFGPTSMFSSRSNSGRKMGPGGSLSRTGEDSGASSRTGTPPQQKEKESATSANAFSLLAGLGSGEPENPASPPSTSVSPALSKATPAGDKSDDKKDNE